MDVILKLTIEALSYVVNGFLFWQVMGFTIATAIFIGASIYDGDTTNLRKGIITIGSYALYLFMITSSRLYAAEVSNPLHVQRYAGVMTIVLVTLAYILGMIIGVYTVKKVRNK